MSRRTRGWTLFLVVGLLVVAGCSRSPEAKKARHLERGDKYAAQEQYRDAILEYRNVLRIDPANARAIRQLGVSYFQLGELAQAFRYLLKAEELAPDAADIRLKLGTIYLLSGKADEARREVTFVLEKEPKNLDGLALLASMAATPEEVDAAIRRLETAQADFGNRAKLHLALGVLYLRKRDVAKAERAFQEAVAKEPKSVDAHVVLGNFYLGKRDVAAAEREFKAPHGGVWPRSRSRSATTTRASKRCKPFSRRTHQTLRGISCKGACAWPSARRARRSRTSNKS